MFFAFASTPPELVEVIEKACQSANQYQTETEFVTWKQNDIVGLDLIDPIIRAISNSDFIVADISSVNFNVVYEIGYAIGLGKRVILVKSEGSQVSNSELNRIGIFDTIGYKQYSTHVQLAGILTDTHSSRVIPVDYEKNFSQPLYVVSCAETNETAHRITSRVKKSKLNYRSFNPSEDIRLSASSAIENISTSLGVILDWRSGDSEIFHRHNARTSFCAGLAHALNIETIMFAPSEAQVPLDFRNSTIPVSRIDDVDLGIAAFVPEVNQAFQVPQADRQVSSSRLSDIALGDPAAENEFGALNRYFLRSAAFSAAVRGSVKTVVGRKGSGKTALWARIRSYLGGKGRMIIVDLKPEGYQLVRLREEVLEHLAFGPRLHLATAFWEYLLLLEISAKIVETDRKLHTRDPRLTEGYRALSEMVSDYTELGDTDFSERLHKLSVGLAGELSTDREFMQGNFTGSQLTNKIYALDIRKLRKTLSDYLAEKDGTWILFDNLDRGWPVHGLEEVDFVILRALIDATRKLERSLAKRNVEINAIVFIRDDIYSELVTRTSDFGKEQPHRIDWRDSDQLREVIRLRLADNEGFDENSSFFEMWEQIFCSHYMGEETSQFIIERSMMRPRNLLNLINHIRSVAINMKHQKIEEMDIEKGLDAFSTDLLVELSREMEDVLPDYETLLWDFVRSTRLLAKDQILETLTRAGVQPNEFDRVLERLLYYGFIGIIEEQEEKYIYDYNYEIRLLLATIRSMGQDVVFSIHPAFRDSLSLR